MFTARYGLSPYINQIRFVFKWVKSDVLKKQLNHSFEKGDIAACIFAAKICPSYNPHSSRTSGCKRAARANRCHKIAIALCERVGYRCSHAKIKMSSSINCVMYLKCSVHFTGTASPARETYSQRKFPDS
jgi:hypothetical protein